MSRLTQKTAFLSALLSLSCLPLSGCMQSTGPTEVGVLVRKLPILGKTGVQDEVFAPGSTYFIIPFINDWYAFDTRVENLEMTADPSRGDRAYDDQIRFKTIDGNDIGLDVIVSYRVLPEKVPFVLQNVASSNSELKNRVVRAVARSITRDIFGELRTEEFYIAELREKKAQQAEISLNKTLEPWGVKVERVSTKDYRFNTEYQQAIEDRKVADQMAEKYKSETHAAAEEYLKKLEQAKGQVNQMTAKADGDFEKTKIESEAYFQQQAKQAEAIRAEGEAEAKGISEMNRALSAQGGEVMVKLKMAEALAGKSILLMPQGSGTMDLKTTNLNQLLDAYGVKGLKDAANQKSAKARSE